MAGFNEDGEKLQNITVIEDDDSEDDRASVSSDEFNLAAALSLRKNLTETFDKQLRGSITSEATMATSGSANNEERGMLKKPPRIPNRTLADASCERPNKLNVVLRVRPPVASGKADPTNTIEIVEAKQQNGLSTTIRTYPPTLSNAAKVMRADKINAVREYEFQHVLGPESTQHDVYTSVAAPLVHGLFPSSDKKLVGDSALLFAYGITNAGKTHTVMGDVRSKVSNSQWGIIPRALGDVFARLEGCTTKYDVLMSYLEIYNEQVFDLLPTDEKPSFVQRPSLKVRERRDGQTFVRGLAKHRVTSVAQGLELAEKAKLKRQTNCNNLNAGSSRSHCICQIELVSRSRALSNIEVDDGRSVASGYSTDEEAAHLMKTRDEKVAMWIVDLAGSERLKRTGTLQTARQKEASQINASLMRLMRCLSVMRDNQQGANSVVPYRESKLTHLFVGHLTGPSAARTTMIVNINPAAADFDETQHVLSYAVAAKKLQISLEAFNKKRKALGFANEYDHNGHRKNQKRGREDDSRLKKLAKLVKKLSPKKSKKARTEQGNVQLVKKQSNLKDSKYFGKLETSRPHDRSIQSLRMELSVSKAEAESLRLQNSELEDRLSSMESEVREEVVEEMEQHMSFVRAEYDRIIQDLERRVKATTDSADSVRKANLDKAEKVIRDLTEKVEECEEEMVRMREEHNQEAQALQRALEEHKARTSKRESEYKEEAHQYKAELVMARRKIKELEGKLAALEKERSTIVEHNDEKNDENIGVEGGLTKGRKLRSKGPGKDENQLPVIKENNKQTKQSQRQPFGDRSLNEDNNPAGDLGDDEGEVGSLMFPKKPAKRDETNGQFSRPSGRAPKGREWDSIQGGWRLSVA